MLKRIAKHGRRLTRLAGFENAKRSSVEIQGILKLSLLMVDTSKVEDNNGVDTRRIVTEKKWFAEKVHSLIVFRAMTKVLGGRIDGVFIIVAA